MQNLFRLSIHSVAATLIALAALAGCSGGDGDDRCEDVTCESGVCDSGSGECVNSNSCGDDDSLCLEGWQCITDACVPVEACNEDGSCDRGTCESGACVNPDMCSTNSDCASTSYCDNGTCVADPCFETTCERGVCELGVGMCVNAEACTTGTEETACVEGNRCVEGTCVPEDEFCAAVACERGVCSFEDLSCANADTCASDMDCVDGFYCGDGGVCEANRCEEDMVNCDRGVCDPKTTECVNPATCAASDECVDGSLCVDGACVAEPQACGTDGCPGNQVCEYDGGSLTATCVENTAEGCGTALDCEGDRVCAGGACTTGEACMDDTLEPNSDAASAAVFFDVATNNRLERLSICSGDADYFTFNNREAANPDGTLLVRADIIGQDVGLGALEIEVLSPSGASLGTATTTANGAPAGFAALEIPVDIVTGGEHTIIVRDSGDVAGPGVRYDLTAAVVQSDILNACATTERLVLGTPVVGATTATTGVLTTSCNDVSGAPEKVYEIEVAREGFLDVQVVPAVGYDVAVSLREACVVDASEVDTACAASSGEGGAESFSIAATPGTYFLVVQSENAAETGNFVINATLNPQICTVDDNSCVDPDTASVCNDRRTGFDTVACPDGCNATTGACLQPEGDSCSAPIQVDAATGYQGLIDWANLSNDYDPGDAGCVPNNSGYLSRTDGPDAVFAVTVPNNSVVTADIQRVGSNYLSAYMLSDCNNDLANSCVLGVNANGSSDEFLYWYNDTGADQDVFIVADSEQWSSYGISPVNIAVSPFVCQPGSAQCVLNRESQICDESGTGFSRTIPCDNGCDAATGACIVTNDVCAGATALPNGVTVQGTIENYLDEYESGACGNISSTEASYGNEDAVFVVTTTAANQRVTIDVAATGFDPIIWMSESCDTATNELAACSTGVDDSESDGVDEQLQFLAPTAGDYFIVIEDGDSGGSVGPFDITATIEAPACVPNTVLGCNMANTAIELCDGLGNVDQYFCPGGGCDPQNGRCANPTGQVCADAVQLTRAGGTISDTAFDNTGYNEIDFDAPVDQCNFSISDGVGTEFIYTIDLFAGDNLEVTFTENSTNSSDYGSVYFLNDCSTNATMCRGFDGSDGNKTISYFARTNETIFVVVDSRTTSSTLTFDFDLSWTVEQPGWLCEPQTRSCSGNLAVTCSEDGFDQDVVACGGSCINGACTVTPENNTCGTAPVITQSQLIAFDPTTATNSVDIPSSNDDCFTNYYGTAGQDAFYQVNLGPNQILEVSTRNIGGTDYPSTYIFDDCADPVGSCILGNVTTSTTTDGVINYQAGPGGESVFLGLDLRGEHTDSDLYMFDIEIRDPECLPTDPLACNADSSGVVLCGDFGVPYDYVCTAGCSNGACVVPRGDACFDAIPLAGTSGVESGDWSGNTNTLEPGEGRFGGCSFDDIDETDGAEDIYSIALPAGGTLTASLDTNEAQARLYFVGDCNDAAATCLASDIIGETEGVVSYHAQVAETVFMVVDRTDTAIDNQYDLTWQIDTGNSCAPNGSFCSDANTVSGCNALGEIAYSATCAAGCVNGGCATNLQNDACVGAIDIGSGMTVVGSYDEYSNTMNFSGSCAGTTEDGPDMFYTAQLQAGQLLRVRATAVGSEDPLIYLLTDCSGAEASCLMGTYEDAPGQNLEDVALEYEATFEQTVIIGIGSESTSADEPIVARMEVLTPDCDPATYQQACNADNTGFTYCNARGFTQPYACEGNGVCDAATGRCQEPVGDVCLDPFVGTPAGGTPTTYSGSFDGLTDDFDLLTGNMCTGSRTPGAEPVYVVDLVAGQTMTAAVVSTDATPADLALYAAPSCTAVRTQCLGGSDQFGGGTDPETLTVTATADGPIFLFVDSFYQLTSGDFDLTVTIN